MRHFILILLCTVLAASNASAQVAEATQAFDKATLALNQGAYSEAISVYETAESEGLAGRAVL